MVWNLIISINLPNITYGQVLLILHYFSHFNSMSFHAVKDTFFIFFTPQPLLLHSSLDLQLCGGGGVAWYLGLSTRDNMEFLKYFNLIKDYLLNDKDGCLIFVFFYHKTIFPELRVFQSYKAAEWTTYIYIIKQDIRKYISCQ